jgi:hypothetical protein
MKRLALVLMLTFGFNCVCVSGAHAMWKSIGRFWEDVKRETTNAAHNTEKTVGKAWEDIKRETTNASEGLLVIGGAVLVKVVEGAKINKIMNEP